MEFLHSEVAGLKSTASEKGVSAFFSASQSKTSPTGDERNLQNKEVHDTGQIHASHNRRSSRNTSLSSLTVRQSWSHSTIPQLFSLATDKRTLGAGKPRDEQLLQKFNFEDSHSRMLMVSRNSSAKSPVAKSICSQNINKQSCSQVPEVKASRFTSTSSFKFQLDARTQQRKEYYSKLQESLRAKEEEMKHMQAKAKKEKEEEIKLLRKSMAFKASPVPSFYQEGPPPKPELLKTPPTRAKSPNFTRRERHSGFSNRLCNIMRSEGELRSSLGPQKPGKANDKKVFCKENQSRRSFVGGTSPLTKSLNKKPAECKRCSSGSATALEHFDVEISVSGGGFEDVQIKVRDPLMVSSDLMMSDEEENTHVVQIAERMHDNSNGGGDQVYFDTIKCSHQVSAVNGGMPKECNMLEVHDDANAGFLPSNSDKTKADAGTLSL